MPKTVYLHIGMQKTGTSSIQDALLGKRTPLKAAGVDYLPAMIQPRGAHHNAAWDLARHGRYRPELPGIEALLAACWNSEAERIFVSSEDFSFLDDLTVTELKAMTQGLEIHPIICIRNQVEWAESMYSQAAKRNFLGSFSEYIATRLTRTGRLDLYHVVHRWIGAFGRDNTHIVVYENCADISEDVSAILGVKLDADKDRRNSSLNERFVAAHQAVVAQHRSSTYADLDADMIFSATQAVGRSMPQFSGSPIFFGVEEGQAFLDGFEEGNRTLAQYLDLPPQYFTIREERRLAQECDRSDAETLLAHALFRELARASAKKAR